MERGHGAHRLFGDASSPGVVVPLEHPEATLPIGDLHWHRARLGRSNDPLVSVSGGVYVWGMVSNTSSTVVVESFGGLFESVDAAERTLVAAEAHIGMLRAIQMDAIDFLDRAQVATADGARTMRDWVAAKADVSPETARDLVRTARYTENRPELRTALLEGDATFDRVVAAARITVDTSEPLFRHLDVAGVRREAARCRTITAEEEQRTFLDRFLVGQPSLDESWWKVFGGLDGYLGALFFKTLDETADQLPDDPQAPKDSSWRRATALGLLVAGDTQAPPQLTVFVDADQATPTDGRAGVYLEAGPRVGRTILETILCDAVTEVIGITGDGTPLRYGRKSRTIPPALRKAIIHRDGNRCAIGGCGSRHRLQVHHITPWSQGGATNPENLITLCWYHHHIAVHQHGLTPLRDPQTRRWTLTRRDRSPPREG